MPGKATVGGTDTVTATSDSDGAITFSLGDATTNGACTVTPDGAVTYLHATCASPPSPCTVTATQAGNDDYNPAPDNSQSVAVAKGDQHLTFTLPASATVGGSDPLTATSSARRQTGTPSPPEPSAR